MNEITKAINLLQSAVRERYGDNFETESGAGTIFIAHDRVEITNAHGRVRGESVESVAEELGVTG